jgi:hypothetical protein
VFLREAESNIVTIRAASPNYVSTIDIFLRICHFPVSLGHILSETQSLTLVARDVSVLSHKIAQRKQILSGAGAC